MASYIEDTYTTQCSIATGHYSPVQHHKEADTLEREGAITSQETRVEQRCEESRESIHHH